MSNDQNPQVHGPKPLSPSAVLKLLRAAGQGTRIELQPEHMAAFDAAIASLAFQHQVRQLVQHAPHAPHAPQAPQAPERPARDTRDARDTRQTRPPRDEARPAAPPRPAKIQPPRPTEGSGAIWTPDEEARLRSLWEHGDAIGAIAEQHKRSPLACFARLIRVGAVGQSAQSEAAIFLIKKNQPVSKGNADFWLPNAGALGVEARPPESASAPAKAPSP